MRRRFESRDRPGVPPAGRLAFAGAAIALAMAFAAPATAADATAGRQKAGVCAACHGPDGLSTLPNAPNLAGQPEIYVSEQLRAYRSGKRTNEQMSVIAKSLSDQDIDDLAAWYNSIKIEAKPPN